MAKVISSLQHPLVKHMVRLRKNSDYRIDHQSVLIEGRQMISEVCPTHPTKVLMVYDETFIPPGVNAKEVITVPEEVMQKISGLQSPDGMIAEVALPEPATLKGMHWVLVCDGVSDPGNLGTLLRTGLAFGWEGAFILENSCDPYNDKALRAAKGATFRLPIAQGSWKDLKQLITKNKLTPLVADMGGTSVSDFSSQKGKGILLVLSNEAHGVSDEARDLCEVISVPMSGEMESLNVGVAGGILMYLLRQTS